MSGVSVCLQIIQRRRFVFELFGNHLRGKNELVKSTSVDRLGQKRRGKDLSMRRFLALIREAISEWSNDKAPNLAAALAYYTTFSLAPLLIIVIQFAALIMGGGRASGHHQVFRDAIFSALSGVLGREGVGILRGAVDTIAAQRQQGLVAAAISWILLLLGALGLVGALQDALNTVWHVSTERGKSWWMQIRKRLMSLAMIAAIAFILIFSLLVNTALTAVAGSPAHGFPQFDLVVKIADFLISLGVVTVLFALVYKYLPDVNVQWSDIWAGAVVTAVLFDVGQVLLGWYLGRTSTTSAYGAAGSLVLILLWVFYSAQILIFGAEFIKVFTTRYGSHTKVSA